MNRIARYFEAVNSSLYRQRRGGQQSADAVMDRARGKLREYARWLDENHDLAVGILDDLVTNIVGSGIAMEPMALTKDGQPHDATNQQLRDLWREFWEWPDVTGELAGDELDALLCRSWLRDGEVFIQHVINRPYANYRGRVPYQIEALEADFVPFDLTNDTMTHGVQKNEWGQPVAYAIYKKHPGALTGGINLDVKTVPAELITHVKHVRRLGQTRGVTIFHAILTRLDDIKDYEESERIAARIAAALTAYIKRNGDYEAPAEADGSRAFEMAPGLIFDQLHPGEDVGTIKSDRPNASLENFRNSQLRAVAAGTSTRFSSIAKNYNGTYSAQRQELVEGSQHYRRLFLQYKHQCRLPIWHRFVDVCRAANLLRLPASMDEASLYRPEVRQPALPWIDPAKEAAAFEAFLRNGLKSRRQIIRDMGGDPNEVDAQIASDELNQELLASATAGAAHPNAAPAAPAAPMDMTNEEAQAQAQTLSEAA